MFATTTQSPQSTGGELTRLPIHPLERNPYQVRVDPQTAVEKLMESIARVGLLNPISVRQAKGGYQIISGHRRVEAFRRLWKEAGTDEERLRYETIPAQVLADVSDEQLALSVLVENLQRVDLDEVEVANGLVQYKRMEGLTLSALAEKTGQDESRVQRLIRLAKAPDFIKDFVRTGVAVTVHVPEDERAEGSGPEAREVRRLDLMGALEFLKTYEEMLRSVIPAIDEITARHRVTSTIQRALEEGWSFREIEKEGRRVRKALKAATGADRATGEPAEAVESAGAEDGANAHTAEVQAPAAEAPQAETATAPIQTSGKSRNPAWDWVSEVGGDVVIRATRFKDLDPLQLQGVYTMLEELKKKAAAYLPAWAVK